MNLPPFPCERCGECCGPVPCSIEEWESIAAFAWVNGIEPIAHGSDCPFLRSEGCAVYEVRPKTCRLFGHVPGLRCPHCPPRDLRFISLKQQQWFLEGYVPTLILTIECRTMPPMSIRRIP